MSMPREHTLTAGSVLSLFDSIETTQVKQMDGISNGDQEFCEKEEREYHVHNDYLEQLIAIPSPESKKDIHDYDAFFESTLYFAFNKNAVRFVGNISYYFQQTYTVTLDSDAILSTLLFPKDTNFDSSGRHSRYYTGIYSRECCQTPNYQRVVAEIIKQLGGRSFKQKAVHEMKATFLERLTQWNENRASLKGKTIQLQGFVGYSSFFEGQLGHHEPALKAFYQCLFHFETGESHITHECFFQDCPIVNGNNCHVKVSEPYTFHDTHFKKVRSLKFFKNGRIDVKFTTNKDAETFFNEYCRR